MGWYSFRIDSRSEGYLLDKLVFVHEDNRERLGAEIVNIISNHFECSKLETKNHLEIIDKEELKSILEMYGKDKKTIKRLCK